jgi:hypothetical protein
MGDDESTEVERTRLKRVEEALEERLSLPGQGG